MKMASKIKELIAEAGVGYKEKARTIYTTCPACGRDDKFSVLKENGSCICYRGSCSFGRKWFPEWLALTLGITIEEAKEKMFVHEVRHIKPSDELVLDLRDHFSSAGEDFTIDEIKPIRFPEYSMIPIDAPESLEGASYLNGRGIPTDLAKSYDIMYSPSMRRVVFPIKMNGAAYGYQGRAIDKVEDGLRMRNNTGFRRDTMVMFLDNLKGKKHAILCEGPVNALKFQKVGGAICTMGKVVSQHQIDLILSQDIDKIYLALDDDAAKEMNALAEELPIPVYKIDVPQSCKDRCNAVGKKADFGECTFDECEKAFNEAKKLDLTQVLIYLKR